MQVLDRTGVGTLWSICKTKFALVGHTHNYAGSGSAGGSANSAISVVDYGQTSKTIQIGYAGSGITGGQIKYIAGYTSGSGDVNAKIKDVSKDALRSWLGLGSLAYSSSSIPTNLSQLTNDKGFVTGSVSGNTITINGASTTWSNTWRGIHDNLTSTSTSESLSANQGRVLKGLVDGKANSSHTHNWSQISGAPATATRWPSWGEVTSKPTMPTNITATKAQIVTISGSTVTVNASLDSYKTPGEFNIYGTSSGDYAKMYVQSGIADTFNGARVITQTIKVTISHNTYAEVCNVTRQFKSNAWSKWTVMYLGND